MSGQLAEHVTFHPDHPAPGIRLAIREIQVEAALLQPFEHR